ncbi:hypothetical protein PILCRDRAFT_814296 [Piloderma croceum F 1598]|uniref:Uncharacterized protein n=1 Tax=Piloderma croceum (strain F 1598) TaxID=765440 RepID=A0A0C3GCM4_PILCF|nr:hypothetical protein PILCRDRAFT_814296 [Piloderma croceum F 1598]
MARCPGAYVKLTWKYLLIPISSNRNVPSDSPNHTHYRQEHLLMWTNGGGSSAESNHNLSGLTL